MGPLFFLIVMKQCDNVLKTNWVGGGIQDPHGEVINEY